MSSNWGDYNGDGRTDYVDYKIYTTQVDPYSGEYQRDAYKIMQEYQKNQYRSQQNSLSFGEWVLCFVGAAIILGIVFSLDIDSELTGIVAMGLMIVFVAVFTGIKNRKDKDK